MSRRAAKAVGDHGSSRRGRAVARRASAGTGTPTAAVLGVISASLPTRCGRRAAGGVQQPGVTTVIPGARPPEQARAHAAAAALPGLGAGTLDAIRGLYDRRIKDQVEHRW